MVKLSLARSITFYAGKVLPLLSNSRPNPHQISPSITVVSALSSLNSHRLFSSEISKPSESNWDRPRTSNDAEDLNNEELKKQIEKLYDGDADAFASVFETILRRKLLGKTDRLDEDLLNELPSMPREDENDGHYKESDSDSDSISDDTDSDEDEPC